MHQVGGKNAIDYYYQLTIYVNCFLRIQLKNDQTLSIPKFCTLRDMKI